MSVLEGLAAYKARKAEEEARREAAQKPRVNRANLEKDGDSIVFRFAQEIDFDAKNYDEGRGLGFINIEHTCGADPQNGWRNRANCSADSQGACYACERVRDQSVEWADRKGWKQKEKFYINIIAGAPREVVEKRNGKEYKRYFPTDIDKSTGDGEVYLLEQGTYNGIWDDLFNYFIESDLSGDTITNKFFKMTRKGSGFNDTSYSLLAIKELPKGAKDLSEFELVNIKEDILQEVPYAQQEAFYYKGINGDVATSEPAASAAPSKSEGAKDPEAW